VVLHYWIIPTYIMILNERRSRSLCVPGSDIVVGECSFASRRASWRQADVLASPSCAAGRRKSGATGQSSKARERFDHFRSRGDTQAEASIQRHNIMWNNPLHNIVFMLIFVCRSWLSNPTSSAVPEGVPEGALPGEQIPYCNRHFRRRWPPGRVPDRGRGCPLPPPQ